MEVLQVVGIVVVEVLIFTRGAATEHMCPHRPQGPSWDLGSRKL